MKFTLTFYIIIALTSFSFATNNKKFSPDIHFKGFSQIYFSSAMAGDNIKNGFSIRRVRLSPYGNITKNISYNLQFSFDNLNPSLLDAVINFKIDKSFQIKTGKFASPGARSGAYSDQLWSTTKMNVIQRAMITQNVMRNMQMSAYRDIGIQVHGTIINDKLYYATMFANPSGSSSFFPSLRSPVYSNTYTSGIKNWTRVEYFINKNTTIGVFFGINSYNNSDTLNRDNSFGFHILKSGKNIKLFGEVISGKNKKENSQNLLNSYKDYWGYFIEAGYVFNNGIMPVISYDQYFPNKVEYDDYNIKRYSNFTVGVNYFRGKHIKFMSNYIFRKEDTDIASYKFNNNIFIAGIQILF